LPANLEWRGHLDEAAKNEILSSAWVLVNTSIHEAMAVSFLEALAHGTTVLACQDGVGVVSRFGVDVGRWDGDGLASLPAFVAGLGRLLEDHPLRRHLAQSGRDWVAQTHTWPRFLAAFDGICARLGLTARIA
jgi:glycosyltransferase involved in cell wall biosynthesis